MRIAVVTPYFKEDRSVLARCMESVRKQAVPVDHILVADGFPQDWVEAYGNVNHVILRKNSADFGDTPRSLGFVVGMKNDYDILQFLDADNVLFPDHMAKAVEACAANRPDLIVARRALLRPDGSTMSVAMQDEDNLMHVDTNCYVFCSSAFHIGLKWSLIPRQFACVGDRIFWGIVRNANLKAVVLRDKTVGYSCMWPEVYKALGETPPAGARDLSRHQEAMKAWWHGLDKSEQDSIQKKLGTLIQVDSGIGQRDR